MLEKLFKRNDELPELNPELKAKISLLYLETLTNAAKQTDRHYGAEIIAAQIFLKIMDETTKAVNKFGDIKDAFTKEQKEARQAFYFYEMMKTKDGAALFKCVYDLLLEVVNKTEQESEGATQP